MEYINSISAFTAILSFTGLYTVLMIIFSCLYFIIIKDSDKSLFDITGWKTTMVSFLGGMFISNMALFTYWLVT